jgi:hypothetical protein
LGKNAKNSTSGRNLHLAQNSSPKGENDLAKLIGCQAMLQFYSGKERD